MPIDYTKSKVYKIVCNETGETYYGSTTQTLSRRMSSHRAKNNKCSSKQIIERGNYDMILCEECSCENKEQLHAIERKWIDENECVNKFIPNRKYKEYIKEYTTKNKDKMLAKKKIYYQENKEEIHIKDKKYNEAHKEEIQLRCKKYYEAHKDELKEKAKIRYELNKKTK